ncbi:MAG: cytochrome c biogenesis protein CcsA [Caldisericia bacterium]
MIGNILLYLTIVLTVVAIFFATKRQLSKSLITAQSIVSIGVMVYMMWALVSDSFQIRYVFHHSEKALPWIYKISALWAGDSGSLILWSAIISIVLLFLVLKKKAEPKTVIVILVFQLFVLASIVFTTPFAVSSKSFVDGQGLNLLLKNFWMLSHPPITFLAYSLMIIPFGITLNFALSKNQSADLWRNQIKPWILATWLFLGVGIVFGAIWSYEVIGWGGYWGWDPVENATLIPWLFLSAALHSLLGNKNTRQNLRSTVGFTLASFVTVVLAVFITRSGILSDVSVHSFTGQPLSIILTILLILSILISIFVYLKLKDKTEKTEEPPLLSKSFLIGSGNLVVLIFSIVILVATFWPVITGFMGSSQVISTSFYSVVLAPVGILLSAGIAFTPIFKWGKTDKDSLPKKLISPMLGGIIGIWLLYELGIFIPVVIILVFISAFTLVSNVMQMRGMDWKRWGSNIAHIGLSILIVGIVVSSNFQFVKQDILRINQKVRLSLIEPSP